MGRLRNSRPITILGMSNFYGLTTYVLCKTFSLVWAIFRRFRTFQIHLVPDPSGSKSIWFQSHPLLNLSDCKHNWFRTIWYWTNQIPNLRPVRSRRVPSPFNFKMSANLLLRSVAKLVTKKANTSLLGPPPVHIDHQPLLACPLTKLGTLPLQAHSGRQPS